MKGTFGISNIWTNTDRLQLVYDYEEQFMQTNKRRRTAQRSVCRTRTPVHAFWLTRQTKTHCDGSLLAHNEIMAKCLIRLSFTSFSTPSLSLCHLPVQEHLSWSFVWNVAFAFQQFSRLVLHLKKCNKRKKTKLNYLNFYHIDEFWEY